MKHLIYLVIWAGTAAYACSQTVLDGYIREGLANNLSLRAREFSLKRSMAALNQARGMFLPSVSLEARYTRAGGGRMIEVPVGDWMNPVYQTLNELLQAAGQAPQFPTDIPNIAEPFIREREHDTKIRVMQPVFQPAIFYNYRLQKDMRDIEKLNRDVFTRQLVLDIKTAYYRYLQAGQIVRLLAETENLIREHVRVTESLFANDKVTGAEVHRARTELYDMAQQQAEAEKQRVLAMGYFNFLLNRPPDTVIEPPQDGVPVPDSLMALSGAEAVALAGREELMQMALGVSAMQNKIGLSVSGFLPGVSAVLDWGYQGEKYRFTPDDDYWMASVVASWNLFNGFRDKSRVDEARYAKRQQENERESLKQQLRLQVREAYQNCLVAQKSLKSAGQRLLSARQTFRIISRKYQEGMASQVEYIDARSSLTRSEVNHVVTRYDVCIRQAEWERVLALYPLPEA